jgi:hypothetical protein
MLPNVPVQIELKKTTIAIKDAHPPPTSADEKKSEPLIVQFGDHGTAIKYNDGRHVS